MIVIRQIRETDTDEVLRMSKLFAKVANKKFLVDAHSIRKLVKKFVYDDYAIALVAEQEGRLIGMLAVFVLPHLFNNNILYAEELVWWVDPDYRIKTGIRMLDTMEKILKDKGVHTSSMKYLHEPGLSPETVHKLYERKGYRLAETIMTKEF